MQCPPVPAPPPPVPAGRGSLQLLSEFLQSDRLDPLDPVPKGRGDQAIDIQYPAPVGNLR